MATTLPLLALLACSLALLVPSTRAACTALPPSPVSCTAPAAGCHSFNITGFGIFGYLSNPAFFAFMSSLVEIVPSASYVEGQDITSSIDFVLDRLPVGSTATAAQPQLFPLACGGEHIRLWFRSTTEAGMAGYSFPALERIDNIRLVSTKATALPTTVLPALSTVRHFHVLNNDRLERVELRSLSDVLFLYMRNSPKLDVEALTQNIGSASLMEFDTLPQVTDLANVFSRELASLDSLRLLNMDGLQGISAVDLPPALQLHALQVINAPGLTFVTLHSVPENCSVDLQSSPELAVFAVTAPSDSSSYASFSIAECPRLDAVLGCVPFNDGVSLTGSEADLCCSSINGLAGEGSFSAPGCKPDAECDFVDDCQADPPRITCGASAADSVCSIPGLGKVYSSSADLIINPDTADVLQPLLQDLATVQVASIIVEGLSEPVVARQLRSVGGNVTIRSNSFAEFDAFPQLVVSGSSVLVIEDNPNLERISFPNMCDAGSVRIEHNPRLGLGFFDICAYVSPSTFSFGSVQLSDNINMFTPEDGGSLALEAFRTRFTNTVFDGNAACLEPQRNCRDLRSATPLIFTSANLATIPDSFWQHVESITAPSIVFDGVHTLPSAPRLHSITASLELTGDIEKVAGFAPGLTTLSGALRVRHTTHLVSLEHMLGVDLHSLAELDIFNNSALDDQLAGFSSIRHVQRTVRVANNAHLRSVLGLSHLQLARDAEFYNNAELRNMNGIQALQVSHSIAVRDNARLEDISALARQRFSCCPSGYTEAADMCVSSTWIPIVRNGGSTRILNSDYVNGAGDHAGQTGDFVVPCASFDGLGLEYVIRVTVGDNTDYFRPHDSASACALLQAADEHEWTRSLEELFSQVPYGTEGAGGSELDLFDFAQLGMRSLPFWSDGDGIDAGHTGAYAYDGVSDSLSWSQPFSMDIAASQVSTVCDAACCQSDWENNGSGVCIDTAGWTPSMANAGSLPTLDYDDIHDGVNSPVDARFAKACASFAGYGEHLIVRMEMGVFVDYFLAARDQASDPAVTACDVLLLQKWDWTNDTTTEFENVTVYDVDREHYGGTDPNVVVTNAVDARTYVSFWGHNHGGTLGGCCADTPGESVWGQPFKQYVTRAARPTSLCKAQASECPGTTCDDRASAVNVQVRDNPQLADVVPALSAGARAEDLVGNAACLVLAEQCRVYQGTDAITISDDSDAVILAGLHVISANVVYNTTSLVPLHNLTRVDGDLTAWRAPAGSLAAWLPALERVAGNLHVFNAPSSDDVATTTSLLRTSANPTGIDVEGDVAILSPTLIGGTRLIVDSAQVATALLEGGASRSVALTLVLDGDARTAATSPWQVASFGQVAPVFNGTLVLQGALDTGASALLHSIEVLAGSLIITDTSFVSAPSFANLHTVHGSIVLANNALLETTQSSFPSLHTVHAIQVSNNAKLREVSMFHSVSTLGGSLFVDWNPALPDLAPLRSLTHVAGELVVQHNTGLHDLSAISTAVRGRSLDQVTHIRHNAPCTAVGAGCAVFIGSLRISANDVYVPGFLSSLETLVGDLQVVGNTNETANEVVPNLRNVTGHVTFRDCVDTNACFASLPKLIEVGRTLQITSCNATSLAGLEPLLVVGGSLEVSHCPDLITLLPLASNLQRVSGDVVLLNNRVLSVVSRFNALESIGGDLVVQDNPLLANLTLRQFGNVSNAEVIGGSISASGNLACVTEEPGCLVFQGADLVITTNPALSDSAAFWASVEHIEASITMDGTFTLPTASQLVSIAGDLILTGMSLHSSPRFGNNLALVGGSLLITRTSRMTEIPGHGFRRLATVEGDLSVTRNENLDLLDFPALSRIGGSLVVSNNPALTTLEGLATLSSVGGNVLVTHNPELFAIDGLQTVATLGGGIRLEANPALLSLDGMPAPTVLYGDLWLQELPLITTLGPQLGLLNHIDGNLVLIDCPLLTTINSDGALAQLSVVALSLAIRGNHALTSLRGLESLQRVGVNVVVEGNDGLQSLDGLDSLVNGIMGSLTIVHNSELVNIGALRRTPSNALRVLGNFECSHNSKLPTLFNLLPSRARPGQESLRVTGGVFVAGNAACIKPELGCKRYEGDVLTFSALPTVYPGSLYTFWNELEVVTGDLDVRTSLGSVAFANLHTVGGSLRLYQDVRSVSSSFPSLTTISNSLIIDSNAALQAVTGFEALERIGADIRIQSNPQLSDVRDIANALARFSLDDSFTGDFVAQGNAFECLSLEDTSGCQVLLNERARLVVGPAELALPFWSSIAWIRGDVLFESVSVPVTEFDMPTAPNLVLLGGELELGTGSNSFSKLSALQRLGSLRVTAGYANNSVDEPASLQTVEGSITLQTTAAMDSLFSRSISAIGGSLVLMGGESDPSSITELSSASLSHLGGSLDVRGLASLQSISLQNVASVENLVLQNLAALETVALAPRADVLNSLLVQSCDTLTALEFVSSMVIAGTVEISDNAGLQSVGGFENTKVVGGDLLLSDNPVLSDLSALADLTSVAGNLTIQGGTVDDLSALGKLQSVGGSLTIAHTSVVDLDGFSPSLTGDTFDITIVANRRLALLSEFQLAQRRVQTLRVTDNPVLLHLEPGFGQLTHIYDSLFVQRNGQLRNLNGLHNVSHVDLHGVIVDNERLSDLRALFANGVTNTSPVLGLTIDGNAPCGMPYPGCEYYAGDDLVVTPVTGVDPGFWASILEIRATVVFDGAGEAFALPSAPKLMRVDGLRVRNGAFSLAGLSTLERIEGDLEVASNDDLSTLSGLDAVSWIEGDVLIEDNEVLTSVAELHPGVLNGGVEINFNPLLVSVAGPFSQLRSGSIRGNLRVTNIAELESLAGLAAVRFVAGDLELANLPRIASLQGLAGLQLVGGTVRIVENAGLRSVQDINWLVMDHRPTVINCGALDTDYLGEVTSPQSVWDGTTYIAGHTNDFEDLMLDSGRASQHLVYEVPAIPGDRYVIELINSELDTSVTRLDQRSFSIKLQGDTVEEETGAFLTAGRQHHVLARYVFSVVPRTYPLRVELEVTSRVSGRVALQGIILRQSVLIKAIACGGVQARVDEIQATTFEPDALFVGGTATAVRFDRTIRFAESGPVTYTIPVEQDREYVVNVRVFVPTTGGDGSTTSYALSVDGVEQVSWQDVLDVTPGATTDGNVESYSFKVKKSTAPFHVVISMAQGGSLESIFVEEVQSLPASLDTPALADYLEFSGNALCLAPEAGCLVLAGKELGENRRSENFDISSGVDTVLLTYRTPLDTTRRLLAKVTSARDGICPAGFVRGVSSDNGVECVGECPATYDPVPAESTSELCIRGCTASGDARLLGEGACERSFAFQASYSEVDRGEFWSTVEEVYADLHIEASGFSGPYEAGHLQVVHGSVFMTGGQVLPLDAATNEKAALFPLLHTITGTLHISGVSGTPLNLKQFAPLLKSVAKIEFVDNAVSEPIDLTPWNDIHIADALVLRNTDVTSPLCILSSTSLSTLFIENAPSLEALTGLETLTSVSDALVLVDTAVEDLAGLAGISFAPHVVLIGNSALANLNGLLTRLPLTHVKAAFVSGGSVVCSSPARRCSVLRTPDCTVMPTAPKSALQDIVRIEDRLRVAFNLGSKHTVDEGVDKIGLESATYTFVGTEENAALEVFLTGDTSTVLTPGESVYAEALEFTSMELSMPVEVPGRYALVLLLGRRASPLAPNDKRLDVRVDDVLVERIDIAATGANHANVQVLVELGTDFSDNVTVRLQTVDGPFPVHAVALTPIDAVAINIGTTFTVDGQLWQSEGDFRDPGGVNWDWPPNYENLLPEDGTGNSTNSNTFIVNEANAPGVLLANYRYLLRVSFMQASGPNENMLVYVNDELVGTDRVITSATPEHKVHYHTFDFADSPMNITFGPIMRLATFALKRLGPVDSAASRSSSPHVNPRFPAEADIAGLVMGSVSSYTEWSSVRYVRNVPIVLSGVNNNGPVFPKVEESSSDIWLMEPCNNEEAVSFNWFALRSVRQLNIHAYLRGTVDIFNALETAQQVYIEASVAQGGSDSYASEISGFRALRSAHNVRLWSQFVADPDRCSGAPSPWRTDSLTAITGFSSLQEVTGDLSLNKFAELHSFVGFRKLRNIDGKLAMHNVPAAYNSFGDFEALSFIGAIDVTTGFWDENVSGRLLYNGLGTVLQTPARRPSIENDHLDFYNYKPCSSASTDWDDIPEVRLSAVSGDGVQLRFRDRSSGELSFLVSVGHLRNVVNQDAPIAGTDTCDATASLLETQRFDWASFSRMLNRDVLPGEWVRFMVFGSGNSYQGVEGSVEVQLPVYFAVTALVATAPPPPATIDSSGSSPTLGASPSMGGVPIAGVIVDLCVSTSTEASECVHVSTHVSDDLGNAAFTTRNSFLPLSLVTDDSSESPSVLYFFLTARTPDGRLLPCASQGTVGATHVCMVEHRVEPIDSAIDPAWRVQFEDPEAVPVQGKLFLPGTGERTSDGKDCPVVRAVVKLMSGAPIEDGEAPVVAESTTGPTGTYSLAVPVGPGETFVGHMTIEIVGSHDFAPQLVTSSTPTTISKGEQTRFSFGTTHMDMQLLTGVDADFAASVKVIAGFDGSIQLDFADVTPHRVLQVVAQQGMCSSPAIPLTTSATAAAEFAVVGGTAGWCPGYTRQFVLDAGRTRGSLRVPPMPVVSYVSRAPNAQQQSFFDYLGTQALAFDELPKASVSWIYRARPQVSLAAKGAGVIETACDGVDLVVVGPEKTLELEVLVVEEYDGVQCHDVPGLLTVYNFLDPDPEEADANCAAAVLAEAPKTVFAQVDDVSSCVGMLVTDSWPMTLKVTPGQPATALETTDPLEVSYPVGFSFIFQAVFASLEKNAGVGPPLVVRAPLPGEDTVRRTPRQSSVVDLKNVLVEGKYDLGSFFSLQLPRTEPLLFLYDPPGDGSSVSLAQGTSITSEWTMSRAQDDTGEAEVGVGLGFSHEFEKCQKITVEPPAGAGVEVGFCDGVATLEIHGGGRVFGDGGGGDTVGGTFTVESELAETISTSGDPIDKEFEDGDYDVFVTVAASVKFSKVRVIKYADCQVAVTTEVDIQNVGRDANTLEFQTIFDVKNTIIPEIESVISADIKENGDATKEALQAEIGKWKQLLQEHQSRRAQALAKPRTGLGKRIAGILQKAQHRLELPPFMDVHGVYENGLSGAISESWNVVSSVLSTTQSQTSENKGFESLQDVLKRVNEDRDTGDGDNNNLEEKLDKLSMVTFSGGGQALEFSYATSIGAGNAFGKATHYSVGAGIGIEGGFTVFGLGPDASAEAAYTHSAEFEAEAAREEGRSVEVSVTLADENVGDYYDVRIGKDPYTGVPVFHTVSGRSMCPHFHNTIPRESVTILKNRQTLVDVPADGVGVVSIPVVNSSPTDEERSYVMGVVPAANPHGLIVKYAGKSLIEFIDVEYEAHVIQRLEMTVERPEGDHYEFEGVEIAVASECNEFAFWETFTLDVYFMRPCPPIEWVGSLSADWTVELQGVSETTLARSPLGHMVAPEDGIVVGVRNPGWLNGEWVHQPQLERVEVQVRLAGSQEWTTVSGNLKEELPDFGEVIMFDRWPNRGDGTEDGLYELRGIAKCSSALPRTDRFSVTETRVVVVGSGHDPLDVLRAELLHDAEARFNATQHDLAAKHDQTVAQQASIRMELLQALADMERRVENAVNRSADESTDATSGVRVALETARLELLGAVASLELQTLGASVNTSDAISTLIVGMAETLDVVAVRQEGQGSTLGSVAARQIVFADRIDALQANVTELVRSELSPQVAAALYSTYDALERMRRNLTQVVGGVITDNTELVCGLEQNLKQLNQSVQQITEGECTVRETPSGKHTLECEDGAFECCGNGAVEGEEQCDTLETSAGCVECRVAAGWACVGGQGDASTCFVLGSGDGGSVEVTVPFGAAGESGLQLALSSSGTSYGLNFPRTLLGASATVAIAVVPFERARLPRNAVGQNVLRIEPSEAPNLEQPISCRIDLSEASGFACATDDARLDFFDEDVQMWVNAADTCPTDKRSSVLNRATCVLTVNVCHLSEFIASRVPPDTEGGGDSAEVAGVGVVVLGAAGGGLLLLVLAIVCYCSCCKKGNKKQKHGMDHTTQQLGSSSSLSVHVEMASGKHKVLEEMEEDEEEDQEEDQEDQEVDGDEVGEEDEEVLRGAGEQTLHASSSQPDGV